MAVTTLAPVLWSLPPATCTCSWGTAFPPQCISICLQDCAVSQPEDGLGVLVDHLAVCPSIAARLWEEGKVQPFSVAMDHLHAQMEGAYTIHWTEKNTISAMPLRFLFCFRLIHLLKISSSDERRAWPFSVGAWQQSSGPLPRPFQMDTVLSVLDIWISVKYIRRRLLLGSNGKH